MQSAWTWTSARWGTTAQDNKITKPVKANLMMVMVMMTMMMIMLMMVMMPGGERRLPARVSQHGGRAPVHLQVVVLVHDHEDPDQCNDTILLNRRWSKKQCEHLNNNDHSQKWLGSPAWLAALWRSERVHKVVSTIMIINYNRVYTARTGSSSSSISSSAS